MNNLEIMQVLVVSTAHVTEEEDGMLRNGKMINDQLPSPLVWPFGYVVFIGDERHYPLDTIEGSDGFLGAAKVARDNNLEWLRFDADGPRIEGAKTYEW
jgi:hypothetical protein